MKKVIDGKLYNTETAKKLGSWDNGCNSNDFNYFREVLYKTKSGAYFIYGEGGPMSKYSQSCGQNQWQGGHHIEPVNENSAKEWAERCLDADDYIDAFGEPEEA